MTKRKRQSASDFFDTADFVPATTHNEDEAVIRNTPPLFEEELSIISNSERHISSRISSTELELPTNIIIQDQQSVGNIPNMTVDSGNSTDASIDIMADVSFNSIRNTEKKYELDSEQFDDSDCISVYFEDKEGNQVMIEEDEFTPTEKPSSIKNELNLNRMSKEIGTDFCDYDERNKTSILTDKLGCFNIQNQFDHMAAGELFLKGDFSFLALQEPNAVHTRANKTWEAYQRKELNSASIEACFTQHQILLYDDSKWAGRVIEEPEQFQKGRVISMAVRIKKMKFMVLSAYMLLPVMERRILLTKHKELGRKYEVKPPRSYIKSLRNGEKNFRMFAQ